ncbi:fungal-specific transcription factor domain-containing protein, partial [Lineolata rhizophorae]
RQAASCTECQRRKQKCSREWPCNHCSARRVSHLCQFASKSSTTSGDSPPENSRKRGNDEVEEPSSVPAEVSSIDADEALKTWGYMPGHQHYNLSSAANGASGKSLDGARTNQSEAVEAALQVIPARSLTDALVQNYLQNFNYRYYPIYPPTFLEDYTKWWTDRARGSALSLEFTCLLLRVCANSAQYLTPEVQHKLEFELVTDVQTLTERYNRAAEKLSSSITPGNGGLIQVQQLFLGLTWLKNEAKFVESWHVLASAVREAQEQGMHKDVFPDGLSEFEIEMRRRMWCLLYTFDWEMSTWLSRPLIVDHDSCALQLPSLRLEDSGACPGLPSPFTHMALTCHLAHTLSEKFRNVHAIPPQELALQYHKEVEDWFAKLPRVYSITDPDTRWDKEHLFVVLQRLQLHMIGNMIKLSPFKPYLTGNAGAFRPYLAESRSDTPPDERDILAKGIECCLKLLEASHELFNIEFPINARFHLVIFCIFDCSTLLCSALIHDTKQNLPQRSKVFGAIEISLRCLQKLATLSKTGEISYSFLVKVVSKLPPSAQKETTSKRSNKRAKTKAVPAEQQDAPLGPARNSEVAAPIVDNSDVSNGIAPFPVTAEEDQPDLEFALDPNGFDIGSLDFGGMEEIWNWETLNID